MLIIDDREQGGIEAEVRRLDVEVAVTRLEYGDCMFAGNGARGPCLVGCERKRLSDLVTSMKDRRLSGHQLRGLWLSYDYVFLFVEGVYRPGAGGEIEELQGRDWRPFYHRHDAASGRGYISYRQVASYLTTLELCGNVIVRSTGNPRETAAQYVALWHWYNDKHWGEHHSHDQIYSNGVLPIKAHGGQWGQEHEHNKGYAQPERGRAIVGMENPTTLWRMAAQLPGVDRRAREVAAHFGTVRAMANADEREWQEINGIGKVTSAAAVRAITEEGA